jgi:hypothetical protein
MRCRARGIVINWSRGDGLEKVDEDIFREELFNMGIEAV